MYKRYSRRKKRKSSRRQQQREELRACWCRACPCTAPAQPVEWSPQRPLGLGSTVMEDIATHPLHHWKYCNELQVLLSRNESILCLIGMQSLEMLNVVQVQQQVKMCDRQTAGRLQNSPGKWKQRSVWHLSPQALETSLLLSLSSNAVFTVNRLLDASYFFISNSPPSSLLSPLLKKAIWRAGR